MRLMVIVKATEKSEAGIYDEPELFEKMGAFNEEMVKAGIMLDADGLTPSSKGARLVFEGAGKPRVIDGPFAETKELVGGFWIIEVASKEEAIEWMSRAPFGPGATLEIRPIMGTEDFAQMVSQNNAAREAALREKLDLRREARANG